jgi:predicted TPR repeat methyltransferase
MGLIGSNRVPEAVEALRAAVALAPSDFLAWTNLGIALNGAGSYQEAAASLERSLELSAEQAEAWLMLGLVRRKLSDGVGAEAAYSAALKEQPVFPLVWQCLGLLKEDRRDYSGAIECFQTCIAQGQTDSNVWGNLGRLYYQTGGIARAEGAYAAASTADASNAHFIHMLHRSQFLRKILESHSIDDAIANYRQAEGQRETEEENAHFFQGASWFLASFGHVEPAARLARALVALNPESASLRYLLDSLSGNPTLDRSPPDYIVESFDAFADGFDAKLVGILGYDVPEKLAAVVRHASAGAQVDVLDAGCGTALCGPLLRPMARRLTGVDLSSKMLERASTRGVYDELVREDLIAALSGRLAQFDIAVAADVLIYFGDLAPLFAAVSGALRNGGLFAFSVERLTAASGYRLLPSGRFAHTRDYVRSVGSLDFEELSLTETTIRQDANERVAGDLFLCRRR